jgi:hypothetical protein
VLPVCLGVPVRLGHIYPFLIAAAVSITAVTILS